MAVLAARVALAAPTGPAAASAPIPRQGWFAGIGLGSIGYVEPLYRSDALSLVYLQGGWRFNRHLALEARAGTDVPGDCGCGYGYYSDPNRPSVQSFYAAYLRATVPLSPQFDVYALAGYSRLEIAALPGIAAAGAPARSASYGLGLGLNPVDRATLELELLPRLARGEGWHADALNIGFHWQF